MKFDESLKDFDESKLSPAQKRTLRASRTGADPNYVADEETKKALGIEKVIAKYKIEVLFGPDRTMQGPNKCCISVWESGKRFHGGGDELVYWCKDNREDHDGGCWGPIIGDNIFAGIALCPNCKMVLNSGLLTGQRYMNVPTKKLAEHVANIWRQLGHTSDIYCKYDRSDIRYKTMERRDGAEEARRLRGMLIYPLKNILKDTAAGTTLERRFEALFKA